MHGLFLGIDCGTQGSKGLLLDAGTGRTPGLGVAPPRRGDARPRIPASRIKHVRWSGEKSGSAWPGFAGQTTAAAGMPALTFRRAT
jgi:hypothetical protein